MFSKDLIKIIAGYEREQKLNYRYLVNRHPWYEYTIHDSYESAIKYIKEKHPDNQFKQEKQIKYPGAGECELVYISFISKIESPYLIMKIKSM